MKEIRLGKQNKYVAQVDDDDYERLAQFKWHPQAAKITKMIYAIRWEWDGAGNRTRYVAMHRDVLGITDSKITIDHIDRNSLNNQKYNLRECPRKGLNLANQPAQRGRKWKGCYLMPKNGRYVARIGGKHISCHATEEGAARAYDSAAIKKYGEFAYLNFPPTSVET